jgi:nitrogen regulatory protein PII-like uncharacterized protein
MRYRKQNIPAITENIISHIEIILNGYEVVISKLDKGVTGYYTIRVNGVGTTSFCDWHIKRSVHRNRILKDIEKRLKIIPN